MLHFLDVSVDVALTRAAGRADSDPASHSLDETGVRHMASLLEAPDPNEGIEIIVHH